MSSSFEKWPVKLHIKKMGNSLLGEELDLYLVSGLMDQDQCETLNVRLKTHIQLEVNDGLWAISTVATHRQLIKAYEAFQPLAKEFRGRYYVIANAFVEACKTAL
jgi:hypothetical protein